MNLDKMYDKTFNYRFRAEDCDDLRSYFEKKAGWIYIAKSKNNDLLKIGRTGKSPMERAITLSTTGVLYDYEIVFSAKVFNQFLMERAIHTKLKRYRVSKEFFNVAVPNAIAQMQLVVSDEDMLLSRFFDLEVLRSDSSIVEYALK